MLHAHPHDGHDHHHAGDSAAPRFGWLRYGAAALLVAAAVLSSSAVMVGASSAVVVTRFGEPVRVITEPGLHWRLPAPIEAEIPVDLRLHTTSSGLLDVGTKDGLRVLVQAYVAWQVPSDAMAIRRFLRSVRNDPGQASAQLRTFLGSAVEVTAGTFELASLLNTDASRIRLGDYETTLQERLGAQALDIYGVTVRQVGIARLTMPTETMNATVERMRAERQTVAEQRMAEGRKLAAEIGSNASRDARILAAKTQQEAADIEASSRAEAARIYDEAYRADPLLYTELRSLDTLEKVVTGNTHIILRTDAAPFRILSDGPEAAGAAASTAPAQP
jgi:modulator of FtsH protease HflC